MSEIVHRYPPINPRCPHIIHGADYNPEQWAETPEVWDQDMELMKQAGCNVMAVGIFSWASLEPREGEFTFGWLDMIMDKLAANSAFAVLATPSGARPAWMSAKYPEILRVGDNRVRILHGTRHNHCPTSPVYREKCRIINTQLARRYKGHPALLVWHVSNEYGGECHCELCQDAFRSWLRRKYGDNLDRLNRAWWTAFWSHTFTAWEQVESPSSRGERSIHGLTLDWRRFVSDQVINFYLSEAAPLRQHTPNVPMTTNYMTPYTGLNYWEFSKHVDVVAWDNYPRWHGTRPDWLLAGEVAFRHDMNRCFRDGQPFMLMESTPSITHKVTKLKRPGFNRLASLQAVAHGADTVQYFQWRKGRGCQEKLHGAVVDHTGRGDTRVFREVAQLGAELSKLDAILGSTVRPEAAVICDWENHWALLDVRGFKPENQGYMETCQAHYRPFWMMGIPVDVISEDCDFARYKLLIAPMLYMVRPGVAERIERFVEAGGTFVATYCSGLADENDLVFMGGFPGPLRKVLGVWAEEADVLHEGESNEIVPEAGNALGLSRSYQAREICDLIHAETATVLARYGKDFYAGRPTVTVNHFGKGGAYYIAARSEDAFLGDLYAAISGRLGLKRVIETPLPQGVTAQIRTDGKRRFIFLLNFQPTEQWVDLGDGGFQDMASGAAVTGKVALSGYGGMVLEQLS